MQQDVLAISDAMKLWAELEDAKNPAEVCAKQIPKLLESENEFIWNLAASYQAVHGTMEQRKLTVEQFYYGQLTARQMLWFGEFASRHYPPKESLNLAQKENGYQNFISKLESQRTQNAFRDEAKNKPDAKKKE